MSYPNISKEDIVLGTPAPKASMRTGEKDEHGEKIILKAGWDKAKNEYNKLKPLIDNKLVFYSEEFRGQ